MTAQPTTSNGPLLPVVAMVGSVVGLCLPPLLLLTGGLGLYCFLRAKKDPAWAPRKQVSAMAMAVSGAGLMVFLGLGLPNVKRVQLRLRQRQCQTALTTLMEAQRAAFARDHRYVELPALPKPEGAETLFLTLSAPDDTRFPAPLRDALGVKGECPACTVTMLCANNVDGDDVWDTWVVSSAERVSLTGVKVPGFVPWNEIDDVGP